MKFTTPLVCLSGKLLLNCSEIVVKSHATDDEGSPTDRDMEFRTSSLTDDEVALRMM